MQIRERFPGVMMHGTNISGGSQKGLDEDSALFNTRFRRCDRLLHFIARRILDDPEQATKAVENCWHSASPRAPQFEYEGAFRSWLLRVLIDEALLLLRKGQQALETNISFDAPGPRRNRIGVVDRNGPGTL
jgi:DNA-directed RNA polymerase specialized sigma24 family protein